MCSMEISSGHRLNSATWSPSPHFDQRPPAAVPELVVIHCVSLPEGEYGTGAPARLFTGRLDTTEHPSFADLLGLRVAPHLLIDRQGEVQQFVAFDQRAWHAGESAWCNRGGCNDYSIGIELEGDVHSEFTAAQYRTLQPVLLALLQRYDLGVDRIVGHNEIAPGRKPDPGPFFDWQGLLSGLARSERPGPR